jgi:hypothetical protein
MKDRARSVRFRGKVESRDAAAPLLAVKGDFAFVERGQPRLLVMRCPCGCGDDLVINLDPRAGNAWRHYQTRHGLTIFPSYWRNSGCRSHFILWNDRIYWCSDWGTEGSDRWFVDGQIESEVLAVLPADRFVRFDQIAQQLNLIPWDVLQACRQLVQAGRATAGPRRQIAEFRRTS